MEIDIPLHGVHRTKAVMASLSATKPEDSGKDPIALPIVIRELWRPDLPRGPATNKDGIQRCAVADLGSNHMPAKRGLVRPQLLPDTILRARN
jgi:hypothetical protein